MDKSLNVPDTLAHGQLLGGFGEHWDIALGMADAIEEGEFDEAYDISEALPDDVRGKAQQVMERVISTKMNRQRTGYYNR